MKTKSVFPIQIPQQSCWSLTDSQWAIISAWNKEREEAVLVWKVCRPPRHGKLSMDSHRLSVTYIISSLHAKNCSLRVPIIHFPQPYKRHGKQYCCCNLCRAEGGLIGPGQSVYVYLLGSYWSVRGGRVPHTLGDGAGKEALADQFRKGH